MKNLGHVNTQSLEEGGDGMFAFYVPLETPNAPNISNNTKYIFLFA